MKLYTSDFLNLLHFFLYKSLYIISFITHPHVSKEPPILPTTATPPPLPPPLLAIRNKDALLFLLELLLWTDCFSEHFRSEELVDAEPPTDVKWEVISALSPHVPPPERRASASRECHIIVRS